MPKSKKNKKADFQKVKLKVGKKLTKGDNVTNLSFKTRQIQLTQTIRDGTGAEPVTKRKLNIQVGLVPLFKNKVVKRIIDFYKYFFSHLMYTECVGFFW